MEELSPIILRLYITGKTTTSSLALANLKEALSEELLGPYELQVIDVLQNPELAEADKILATPTLIKVVPLPIRKIIGNLANREQILLGLNLTVK